MLYLQLLAYFFRLGWYNPLQTSRISNILYSQCCHSHTCYYRSRSIHRHIFSYEKSDQCSQSNLADCCIMVSPSVAKYHLPSCAYNFCIPWYSLLCWNMGTRYSKLLQHNILDSRFRLVLRPAPAGNHRFLQRHNIQNMDAKDSRTDNNSQSTTRTKSKTERAKDAHHSCPNVRIVLASFESYLNDLPVRQLSLLPNSDTCFCGSVFGLHELCHKPVYLYCVQSRLPKRLQGTVSLSVLLWCRSSPSTQPVYGHDRDDQ